MAICLDVTDVSSVERAFADAASAVGGVDIVINVAGGDTHHGTFEETTDDVWVKMIELNLLGPLLSSSDPSPAEQRQESCDRQCQLDQRPRRSGQRTLPSAKAGIGVLTINLAASLAADGIRVNTVAPATIRTRKLGGTHSPSTADSRQVPERPRPAVRLHAGAESPNVRRSPPVELVRPARPA